MRARQVAVRSSVSLPSGGQWRSGQWSASVQWGTPHILCWSDHRCEAGNVDAQYHISHLATVQPWSMASRRNTAQTDQLTFPTEFSLRMRIEPSGRCACPLTGMLAILTTLLTSVSSPLYWRQPVKPCAGMGPPNSHLQSTSRGPGVGRSVSMLAASTCGLHLSDHHPEHAHLASQSAAGTAHMWYSLIH